jgi:hypothetical protein
LLRSAAVGACILALAACGRESETGSASTLADTVTGTRLAAGDLSVGGVIPGYAAAFDWNRGALAVPLAGGEVQVIDAAADSIGTFGDVIVVRSRWDDVTAIGDLRLWTPSHAAQPVVQASSGLLAIDDTSTRILATAGSSDDGTSTNVVVVPIDGSPSLTAFAASRATGCGPSGVFSDGRFVVAHCSPGTTTVNVSIVDPATGASTDLLTDTELFFATIDGFVAAVRSTGEAFLIPISGGPMTPIGANVEALFAMPDRASVLVMAEGSIWRASSSGGTPLTLVPEGAARIWDTSPDGATLLFRQALGPRHAYGDLFLTSALAPTASLTLSWALDATTFGSAFTADSRRVLYVTGANDLFVGTLQGRLVSGDGTVATYGQNVWTTIAYADSRIVFTSDYLPVPKRPGLAVLRVADTADDGAPTTVIATSAGPDFALTPARDAVVFSFNDGSDRSGLYSAPLPGAVPITTDGSVSEAPPEAADAGLAAPADGGVGDVSPEAADAAVEASPEAPPQAADDGGHAPETGNATDATGGDMGLLDADVAGDAQAPADVLDTSNGDEATVDSVND